MGKRKAVTQLYGTKKNTTLPLQCYTTKTNIIVHGRNYTNISGYTSPHIALSYVSSGIKYENNDEESIIANMFTIGYKSKNTMNLYSRHSNDKFKYIAAMEMVTQDLMIWTDNVSLPLNIPRKRIMSEIGQAYSTALYTIAILEADDANILLEVVSMLNKTIKHIEFGNNTCNSFTDRITAINTGIKIPVKTAKTIIKETYKITESIANSTEKRGQYSYWSRAWTMQEQHQSNTIQYSSIKNSKLHNIVDSSELVVWSSMVLEIMKNVKGLMEKYDSNTKITSVINNLFAFLTGTERRSVSAQLENSSMDAEGLLINDIVAHPRCATDARQMNLALCIALGIFVEGDTKRWKRILGRMVNKGFIPLKRRHGIYLQEGWIPEGSNVEFEDGALSQYCSTAFMCFMRFEEVPEIRAFIDYEGKLVIRSYLMQLTITRRSPRKTKIGVAYVMKDVALVDNIDNKVISNVVIEIKAEESNSVKLNSTMVYEKADSSIMEGFIHEALLVGGGAFAILNKPKNRIIASIISSSREKRKWRDFYNKLVNVGKLVFVQLDGVGDDIGYY